MSALLSAAAAVALLVWAVVDSPEARLERRVGVAFRPSPGRGKARPHGGRVIGRVAAITGAIVLVLGVVAGPSGVLGSVVALLVGGTALTLGARVRGRRAARRSAAEIARAAEELSGLLRVGGAPGPALARVAEECPALGEAAALQAIGGDPVAAFRAGASRPSADGLDALAAAWQVATRTGAPMSTTLSAIAEELERREEMRAVVTVELAAARTAGLLLAVLPLVGVLLGVLLRADPVGFLARDPVGQGCGVIALALVCAGLLWTDTLTARAAP